MRAYLLPFGDLVSWCLMSTHFHWQFYVKEVWITRRKLRSSIDKVEYLRRKEKYGVKARQVDRTWGRVSDDSTSVSLNESIGELLRTYARAINKERNYSGSLFREDCKAKDGWIDEFVTLQTKGKDDFRFKPRNDYAYRCFCYIHDNPQMANVVSESTDYPWSSAKDYFESRQNSICNLEMGKRIIDNI